MLRRSVHVSFSVRPDLQFLADTFLSLKLGLTLLPPSLIPPSAAFAKRPRVRASLGAEGRSAASTRQPGPRWGLPREGPAGALSLPPGGALRVASAALSFRSRARTGARGTSAPTGPRLTPAPPSPSWGGSAQLVPRVLPEASPRRWDFSVEAATLLWRGYS